MKKSKLILIVLAAVFILHVTASACPLCQAGATKRTQKAYEQTTALLALLPILAGGGIGFWLYNKTKHSGQNEQKLNE